VSELDQELERIKDLANRIYSNFCVETRVEEQYQLLACIIRNLEPKYFNQAIYQRQSTKQLLDASMAAKVTNLYKFVGTSDLSGLLKAHVCGDAAGFLKNVCGASPIELEKIRISLDFAAFFVEFF
jgi:hypothetical protein